MFSIRHIASASLRRKGGLIFPTSGPSRVAATATASVRSKSDKATKAAVDASTIKVPPPPPPPLTATAKVTTDASTAEPPVPIGLCLLAAAAGVATVSATAAIVETATASNVPNFDPNLERYDTSTFAGRFSRMLLACDPRLLVYSDERVRKSQEMVVRSLVLYSKASL